MNVLIKNMKMPTKGEYECTIRVWADGTAMLYGNSELIDGGELVPVPPHGDLIDRDALIADDWFLMKVVNGVNCAWTESKKLKDVPIIIPADNDINVLNKEEGE